MMGGGDASQRTQLEISSPTTETTTTITDASTRITGLSGGDVASLVDAFGRGFGDVAEAFAVARPDIASPPVPVSIPQTAFHAPPTIVAGGGSPGLNLPILAAVGVAAVVILPRVFK